MYPQKKQPTQGSAVCSAIFTADDQSLLSLGNSPVKNVDVTSTPEYLCADKNIGYTPVVLYFDCIAAGAKPFGNLM